MESLTPTDEVIVPLLNGGRIRSGWIDKEDPDMLPAGDYIAVENAAGEEVCYLESSDLFCDPVECRQQLNAMMQACAGPTPAAKSVATIVYDAYEISPCIRLEEPDHPGRFYFETCDPHEATVWTLYGHIPGAGVEAIGDFDTFDHAADVYARITGRPYVSSAGARDERQQAVGEGGLLAGSPDGPDVGDD